MKKFLAILALVAFLGGGAIAQSVPTLDAFENAFLDFAKSMAGTLAVNSTIGSTWSDAFIGKFPHLGAGLSFGVVYAGKDTVQGIFDVLGQPVPEGFAGNGIPIPALAATAKLGFPFLPLDLGLKVGTIPPSMGESLKQSMDIGLSYSNVGAEVRLALAKETFLIPDISIGVGANYQKGKVTAPTGIGAQTLSFDTGYGDAWDVSLSDPDLLLSWESMTFDASVQMSKTLLFILTPYIGAGYSFGKSTVTGGLDSTLSVSQTQATYYNGPDATQNLVNAYHDATGKELDMSSGTGFSYTVENNEPVLRLYGGFSLNILVVFDVQVIVIPKTKDTGFSFMARLQF